MGDSYLSTLYNIIMFTRFFFATFFCLVKSFSFKSFYFSVVFSFVLVLSSMGSWTQTQPMCSKLNCHSGLITNEFPIGFFIYFCIASSSSYTIATPSPAELCLHLCVCSQKWQKWNFNSQSNRQFYNGCRSCE